MRSLLCNCFFAPTIVLLSLVHHPSTKADDLVTTLDVPYATVQGTTLRLDLHRSDTVETTPLIVWVHGGAWRAGSKNKVPIKGLIPHGFSIASVDYRLSGTARFPAQTYDIKAAIRFLRANAEQFKIDPNRIVIVGASAGGHLAALVGVSDSVATLESLEMGNPEVSSGVSAIVSLYGASNLETILSQSTPHGLSVREPALKLLLGDLPTKATKLAHEASPVVHVDKTDPPLLLIHGDQDPQMPINQSHELEGHYQDKGCDVTFHVLHGAAHGGKPFYTDENLKRISDWIWKRIR